MNTVSLAIAALLFIVSAIHLYHSIRCEQRKRMFTKPFLLPLIIAFYISVSSSPSVLLIVALVFSWLGDVLLMPKGNKWFTAGGISFMMTHFIFIAVYAFQVDFKPKLLFAAIPAAILYYGISAIIIKELKAQTPKKMLIPMYVYLLSNSTMNIFSMMQLISDKSSGAVIAFIGAILFFISDCTLFLVRYSKKESFIFKNHFTVMLTYIAGEFMITLGIYMLRG